MARLRAVKPGDEKPAPALSVTEAAEKGSHRDLLVAMRTRLAKAVQAPDCPPRDLAALTRRLQDVAREIHAIDARDGHDALGEAVASADDEWDAEAL
jgi:hypothetical protein